MDQIVLAMYHALVAIVYQTFEEAFGWSLLHRKLQLKCLKIGNIDHRGLLHHLLLNSGEIDAENLSPNWTWLLSILPNNTQLLLDSSKFSFPIT